MSRDFDKAQEMVWASMEYVKVLGFRIRRTEVQRDDWKLVAQSHADELIKLRQRVDELKAERDALRSTTIDTAAGHLLDAFGSLANEPRHGATDDAYRDRIVTKIHTIKLERDALRAECDDLRRVFALVHGSLGIQQGEHIGNAIEALKKERDELMIQVQDMRAEIERLKKPARQHPVKVGEYVRRDRGDDVGQIAQVLVVQPGQYEVQCDQYKACWAFSHCTPCDPPESTHDTPAGKETAQAAAKPKPGDMVRLVRVPTADEYPHDTGRWEPNWGGIGDYMRVHYVGSNINGTRVVRAVFGLEWPLSCVEIVKGGE